MKNKSELTQELQDVVNGLEQRNDNPSAALNDEENENIEEMIGILHRYAEASNPQEREVLKEEYLEKKLELSSNQTLKNWLMALNEKFREITTNPFQKSPAAASSFQFSPDDIVFYAKQLVEKRDALIRDLNRRVSADSADYYKIAKTVIEGYLKKSHSPDIQNIH